MLVALSLPEMIGEFFEFFSLTEKVSAGAGPALTAAMLFIFGGGAVGYRICIGSLATIIAAGHFSSSVSPTPVPKARSTSSPP